MERLSREQGEELIRLARKSIEYFLATGRLLAEKPEASLFENRRGVFVSLKSAGDKALRGCIGFPKPSHPLWLAVIQASVSAAFNDPRFPPLKASELDDVVLEISVLTEPQEIEDKADLPQKIEIGRDGLIIEKKPFSGLLLPQVPLEWNWSAEEFLEQACEKANLLKTSWQEKRTKVFKFQAQVFSELAPKGKIAEE